jgi:hypothetical protein
MGVQHAELNECVDNKLAKISELVTSKLNDNKQLKSQISKELEVSTRELINKEMASIHNKRSEDSQLELAGMVANSIQSSSAKVTELTNKPNRMQERLDSTSCSPSGANPTELPQAGAGTSCHTGPELSGVPTETRDSESVGSNSEVGPRLGVCMNHGTDVNVLYNNNNGGTRHASLVTAPQSELVTQGQTQCHSSIINDMKLPIFSDASKQNAVQFLSELENYFTWKSVPNSLKLVIAGKAITDGYAKRWLQSVQADLKDYDEFKTGFTELLWNASIQAEIRSSVYQDKYDRSSGETLSDHFLKYSVKSVFLTPRLTELDLITAVSSHFPKNIHTAILASNVSTIQGTLNLLRRLEALEDTGPGRVEGGTRTERGQAEYHRPPNRDNRNHNRGGYYQRQINNVNYGHHSNFRGDGRHHYDHQDTIYDIPEVLSVTALRCNVS